MLNSSNVSITVGGQTASFTVGNATLNDGKKKGRQTLYNADKLKGDYITNGKAIKIKCFLKKNMKNMELLWTLII